MSDDFTDGIVKSMVDCADEHLVTFAFHGFNPVVLRGKIRETATHNVDLPVLLSLYIQRGTNLNKIIESVGEEAKSILRDLVNKYSIKSRVGATKSRTTITLSRLAACFPDGVCRTIQKRPDIYQGPMSQTDWPNVPKFMMVPCFASLIPNLSTANYTALSNLHLDMMVDFDRIINPKSRTDRDIICKYHLAARKSPLFNSNQRMKILAELGMLQTNKDDGKYEFTQEYEDLLVPYYPPEDDVSMEEKVTTSGKRGTSTRDDSAKKRRK